MKKLFLLVLVLFFSTEIFSQPLPPADLTAQQNNWGMMIRVKLTWTASPTTPVYYSIYRKNGALNDTIPFIKKYTHLYNTVFYDRQVQDGHTYSYYVTAYNLEGESTPSNFVEITLGGSQAHGVIAGQILNENTNLPVPGSRATFISLQGGHNTTIMADSSGNFSRNVIPGDYYVRFSAMGFTPEFFDNAPAIQNAQLITVAENDSFFLPALLAPYVPPVTYTVAGNVSNAAGEPLAARLHAYRVYTNSEHLCGFGSLTDSLGNFVLNVRENDTIVVFARPLSFDYLSEFYNNKATFEEADRIVVTGNITGIDFVLEPKPVYANGIAGLVQNAAFEPVPSLVSAFRKTMDHFQKRRYTTATDSAGVYGFNNMIPGEYILLACPAQGYSRTYFRYDGTTTLNWYEADSVVVTETGIVQGINFTVAALPNDGFASVTGYAFDNSGAPVNGAHIYALDENRMIFTYAVSDMNGFYVLNGLQPGEYKLYSDKVDYLSAGAQTLNVSSILQNSQLNFILTPDAVTGIEDENNLVTSYELYQNYPNPFNPSTTIRFAVPENGLVKLSVYDILGREVKTLVNEVVNSGIHTVQFDGSDLSSGIYLYKIQSGSFSSTKKLMLLK